MKKFFSILTVTALGILTAAAVSFATPNANTIIEAGECSGCHLGRPQGWFEATFSSPNHANHISRIDRCTNSPLGCNCHPGNAGGARPIDIRFCLNCHNEFNDPPGDMRDGATNMFGQCASACHQNPRYDPCASDPCAGVNCDDGIACTTDTCVDGNCVFTPDDAACDDGVACTDDVCDPVNDCQNLPNTLCCNDTDCDDGDPCTDDICGPDGQCTNPQNGTCQCQVDEDCNDQNACTSDACIANQCENTPITCDDGNACTTDSCDTAVGCIYSAIDCNDDNPCTDDSCDAASGCVNAANDNNTCDDGNACSTDDACLGGACVGDTSCDDGDPCTDDTCGPNGCTHTNTCGCMSDADCDDKDACTVDVCTNTVCENTPISCDDGNACTDDTCDPVAGCGYNAINCDDGNVCTDDSCDPAAGCQNTPNIDPCDDGDMCTLNDTCIDGACLGEVDPGCSGCIPPIITAIRGDKVAAGRIRILGTGFGNQVGMIHINGFKIDLVEHPSRLKLWSDTKIVVRLPQYKCAWFTNDKNGDDTTRRRSIWITHADGCEGERSSIRVKNANCKP